MISEMVLCRYRWASAVGRAVGVILWELVDYLSKEPLAGALVVADAAHLWNLSPAEPLRKQICGVFWKLPDAAVFDDRHHL